MRRIMTGEQVARSGSNPDSVPALPVWRAPVYRTPAGFVWLLAQLARLLGRLARLAARHTPGPRAS